MPIHEQHDPSEQPDEFNYDINDMTQLDFTPLHNSSVMDSYYRENPNPYHVVDELPEREPPDSSSTRVRSEHFQFQQIQQQAIDTAMQQKQEEKRTNRHLEMLRAISAVQQANSQHFVYYFLHPDSPAPARTDKSLEATFFRYVSHHVFSRVDILATRNSTAKIVHLRRMLPISFSSSMLL
jgi:hypothetical protein